MSAKANFENRTLFISDNLPVLRGLNSATVDLVYLDPPFNSKREYKAPIGTPAEGQKFDDTWRWTDLDNRWLGEIDRRNGPLGAAIHAARQIQGQGTAAYLTMMSVRLLELHRVLKPTGSLYLHCDPTASHYLKTCLDAVFGKANFRNEIIWHYRKWANTAQHFQKNHDALFFYTKGPSYVFNKQFDALSENQSRLMKRGYNGGTSGGTKIVRIYNRDAPAVQAKLAQWKREGRRIYDVAKPPGMPVPSVWAMPIISGGAKERTGWRTQKPLALLRRVIKASSNPGDVVLDPFAGCATACVAAEMEGRQWIGIEACENATDIIQVRLDEADLGGLGAQAGATRKITIKRKAPRRNDAEGLTLAKKRKTAAYKTDENFDELYGKQRGCCNGCGEHLKHQHLTFDHITPQVRDGTDEMENLQLLCSNCNSTKGDGTMDDLKLRLKQQAEKMRAKREAIGRAWTP